MVQVQGGRIVGSHIQNSLADQNCVQQMGPTQTPIYMNQPQQAATGVMPAQMGGPHHPHAIPAHMGGPHPQSHSQPSHMTGGNHPTPSPVQQQHGGPPQQVSHPPPSSGTPQPQPIIYQANPMQMSQPPAGHPPLQPSPHTPTSPHNVYPPVSAMFATPQYPYNAPQQGMPPPQGLQPPNMGHHQQPPQYVMMQPHPPGQNQQQQQPQQQQQQQQHIQLQQHMHHMQGWSPDGAPSRGDECGRIIRQRPTTDGLHVTPPNATPSQHAELPPRPVTRPTESTRLTYVFALRRQ
ncbi:hypothetical protein LSAT2_007904 [Lamellibrachia satsuma]|nr:hypothetical protein LSAT2_007904 [Lamellibrachia satsuma]